MQITVIGAASVDMFIKSKQEIAQGEKNPADVRLRAGGEARNIASMLVRRGVDVNLITAVGDDPLGALLKDSCENFGIKTNDWIIKGSINTCVNVETIDNHGKLHTGFCATTAPEAIRPRHLARRKDVIKSADLLIMDLNLSEETLAAAIELREGNPVLIDAVSAQNAKRAENLLPKIDILKLNRRQAESLTGITLDTKDRVKHACYNLVTKGAGRVFITLGVAGACASDDNYTIFVPTQPVAVKDIAGAGAAFITGLALGTALDLRSQAEQAVAYAVEHLEAYLKR